MVDIAVHPSHQRQGLGKQILERITKFLDEEAPMAYVSLIADPGGGQTSYPRHGWKDVNPSIGMAREQWPKKGP